ncbi:MAG: LytR/AlgR family response regulator transcription factor [Salibacteraceae bacterium]
MTSPIKAVIVDDVKDARTTLQADLASYCPEVNVIGEADGVVSGAKLLRKVKPEVVFLDIQKTDGSGFDLLEIFDSVPFKVIFTTASDAHAIQAFRFSAVDYLLKPIDPDELMEAVRKLGQTKKATADSDQLGLLKDHLNPNKKPKRLALHTQDKIHVVEIDSIVRCESNVNYTMFYFKDKTRLLVTKTLKEFDELLRGNDFLRVHQSHLINAAYLKEFVKIDGGYLVMKDQSEVPVSTRKRNIVLEAISRL